MVSWENSPKKEGAYPKREIDTKRLQNYTHRLQQTTKVGYGLQILLINYKRLQKSDIDFKDLLIPLLTKFVVSAF